MTHEEKVAAAMAALRNATLDFYEDDWSPEDSVANISPIALADIIAQAVEELLGVWELEWDYDADTDLVYGSSVATYWFKVTDPRTGCVLTHRTNNLTGEKLSYCRFMATLRDAVQAIVDLADIIAEKLPVACPQISHQGGEGKWPIGCSS
jgi:hypothetical protein